MNSCPFAWLGLVPRQYSTGGRSILGRISKRGSKYLRTLLIQAAKVLPRRRHLNNPLL
jgi:transposase